MRKRGRKAHCVFCGSHKTISRGVRVTITQGIRRRRECLDCNRRFTVGRPAMPQLPVEQTMPDVAAILTETPSLLPPTDEL